MAGDTQKAKGGDKNLRDNNLAAGAEIVYGFGDTALGVAMIAFSPKGVCALMFGEQEKKLTRELCDDFPGAQPATPEMLAPALAAARSIVERPWGVFALPLDVRGTDFQRRVWSTLCGIAPGTTVSYAEVARRIGQPKALRAVAGACAANRLAIVIPCHRVLRLNGSLSGYRWGRERKLKLIEMERDAVTPQMATV